MKVAAVQFRPTFKDKEGNLGKLARLVAQAAGSRLIVLPELCTTGYSFMSRADAEPLAEIIGPGGTTFEVFRLLAAKLNAYIVWGMVEKDVGTGNLYNAQVCVAPDSSFTTFRKINLWGNDYLWAKPGRSNPPILDLDGRKLGMLICRDARNKKDDKWKDFYEKGDADIVALSANWGDGGFPAVSWMDFSEDNGVVLIVSNRWGEEIPNDFGEGGVCVIWPDGRVMCDGLIWNSDCVVYAEVSTT
jgi:predicted amidohydrolase